MHANWSVLASIFLAVQPFVEAAPQPLKLLDHGRAGAATPTALASADFDGDGMPDLAVAYAGVAEGAIVIHRGNVDALFPNAPAARQRRQEGTFVREAFLPGPTTMALPFPVDFLGAVDFDGDDHPDLVAGTRGATRLHFLRGDDAGWLSTPAEVELGGRLEALAVGGEDWPGRVTRVVLAVASSAGPNLVLLEDPRGVAHATAETIPTPRLASIISLARVRGTADFLIFAAAGDELLVVDRLALRDIRSPGASFSARSRLHRLALPSALSSMAWGDFLSDPESHEELAVVTTAGRLRFLDIRRMSGTWIARRVGPEHGFASGSTVFPMHITGAKGRELLVFAPGETSARVMSERRGSPMAGIEVAPNPLDFSPLETWSYPVVTGKPSAVLPMRLNADAMPDLVLLQGGADDPTLALTAPLAVITVNTALDNAAAADGRCTLREAINNANANGDTTGGDCAQGSLLDTIAFGIGGGGSVASITVTGSDLPEIWDRVTIDGSTQGCAAGPCVELDGGAARGTGLSLEWPGDSVVRGLAIRNFLGAGIYSTSGGNIVEGNRIGTDSTGMVGQGNGTGVALGPDATGNVVGGWTAAATNLISGNYVGIAFYRSSDPEIPDPCCGTISGNDIGTNATRSGAIPNQTGINSNHARAYHTSVSGNLVAGNEVGIRINDDMFMLDWNVFGLVTDAVDIGNGVGVIVGYGWGNRLSGNVFAGSSGLGIDLGGNGVTENDPWDVDDGPNALQNFPVLTSVLSSPSADVVVEGALDSTPEWPFRIELFASRSCDSTGYGEGQRFLGVTDVVTDGEGAGFFSVSLPASLQAGEVVTATATSPTHGTSEFSACAVASCSSLAVFPHTVLASSKDHLTWGPPADVRWVKGDLADVDTYSTIADGELLAASGLDLSGDHPAPGTGLYYLVRPLLCGSWQSSPGSEPGRDQGLP